MQTSSIRNACATLTFVLALGLAACGDGTGPESTMSQERARKVAQAVSQQTYTTSFGGTSSATAIPNSDDGALSAEITAATTISLSFSRDCPGGGSVSWSGEAFQNDAQDSVSVDAALQYDGCTTTVDQSTVTVTTTDEFNFAGTLLRPSNTEMDWSSQLSGSFDWTMDGDSGSCSLDLQTDVTATGIGVTGEGSIDAATTGRVCGHDVERTFSLQASS